MVPCGTLQSLLSPTIHDASIQVKCTAKLVVSASDCMKLSLLVYCENHNSETAYLVLFFILKNSCGSKPVLNSGFCNCV